MCDEVLPTAGGHVLSPILTCRSILDLTGVGSTSCLCLSVCLSSISVSAHAYRLWYMCGAQSTTVWDWFFSLPSCAPWRSNLGHQICFSVG